MKRTLMFLKLLLTVAAVLAFAITYAPPALADDPVAVDRATNQALYDALIARDFSHVLDPDHNNTIMASELRNMTGGLFLEWFPDITNIDGLQYCSNLTTLSLAHDTGLTDISPLTGLSNLVNLDLRETGITAFPALSGMSNLSSLSVWGCAGLDNADMASLLVLPNVGNASGNFSLTLNQTNITDLSCFLPAAAPGLKTLHCAIMPGTFGASNVQTISGCTQLKALYLNNNPNVGNSSLPYIAGLVNLTTLNLDLCSVSDLSGISGMHLKDRPSKGTSS